MIAIDKFLIGISSNVINSIAAILISICIFYAIFIYVRILSRESTNFDTIAIDPPMPIEIIGSGNSTVIGSSIEVVGQNCANGECCNLGTVWDSSAGKCEPLNKYTNS